METIHVDLSRVPFEEHIDIDIETGNQPEVVINLEDSKAGKPEGFRKGLVGCGQGPAPCGGQETGGGEGRVGQAIGDPREDSLQKSTEKNLRFSVEGQNHLKIDPKSDHSSHSPSKAKRVVAQTGRTEGDGHKGTAEKSEVKAVVEIDREFAFVALSGHKKKEVERKKEGGGRRVREKSLRKTD